MSLWIRTIGDGAVAVYKDSPNHANMVAVILDDPADTTHSVVYNHECTQILGDVRSSCLDDCLTVVRNHLS